MTINKKLVLTGSIVALVAAVIWISVFDPDDRQATLRDNSLTWFQSGAFEVGVATIPATPRVGENKLIVNVRLTDGSSASNVEVSAYAEMGAMGAMPAMRAPADLAETASGQFEGAVDLRRPGLPAASLPGVHLNSVASFWMAPARSSVG